MQFIHLSHHLCLFQITLFDWNFKSLKLQFHLAAIMYKACINFQIKSVYIYTSTFSDCWLSGTASGKCSCEWIEDCERKTFCSLPLWLAIFLTIVLYFRKRKSNITSFLNHRPKCSCDSMYQLGKGKINGEGKYVIFSCVCENRKLPFGEIVMHMSMVTTYLLTICTNPS